MDNEKNGLQISQEKKTQILIGNKGIEIRSFEDLYRFSQAISKSGLTPKGLESPESIMIAIQMGLEIGLSPMKSLQSVAVINGRPTIYGDAAKAMVLASPACEYVNEHYEGEGDDMVAICVSKRHKGEEHKTTFSVAEAKKAGLWNKNSVWSSYGKRMLMMRARSYNLRDNFADVLGGYSTYEEVQDYTEITSGPTIEVKKDNVAKTIADTVKKLTPKPEVKTAPPVSKVISTPPIKPIENEMTVAPVAQIAEEVTEEESKSVAEDLDEIGDTYTMDVLMAMEIEELKGLSVDNNIDYNKFEGKNTKKKLATLIWEKRNGMPSSINLISDIAKTVETEAKTNELIIPEPQENGVRRFPDMKMLFDYMANNLYENDRIMTGIKACGMSYTSKEDMAKRAPSADIHKILASC